MQVILDSFSQAPHPFTLVLSVLLSNIIYSESNHFSLLPLLPFSSSQPFPLRLLQKASNWSLGSPSSSSSDPNQNLAMATHCTQNKIHLLILAFKVLLLSPALFLPPFYHHWSCSGHTGPLVGPEICKLPPPPPPPP